MKGKGGIGVFFKAKGIFHSPLVGLHSPMMMILSSLAILTSYFENRETQLSSKSWPIEIRELDLRLSKTWLTCASVESYGDRGTISRLIVSMVSPLATWTEGPDAVRVTSRKWGPYSASR